MVSLGMNWLPSALIEVPEGADIPVSAVSGNHNIKYTLIGLGQLHADGTMLAHYVRTDRLAKVRRTTPVTAKPKVMQLEDGRRFVALDLGRDSVIPAVLNHEGATWALRHGNASTYTESFTSYYDEVTS